MFATFQMVQKMYVCTKEKIDAANNWLIYMKICLTIVLLFSFSVGLNFPKQKIEKTDQSLKTSKETVFINSDYCAFFC